MVLRIFSTTIPLYYIITSTLQLNVVDTLTFAKIPVFRILSLDGLPLPGSVVPELDPEVARTMYKIMIRIQTVDDIFYNAQRQGRISFYMQNTGEEATHIGKQKLFSRRSLSVAYTRK